MENTEVKTMLSERLGLPISFFNGETPEEDIATARALCDFRREHEQTREKSNAEKFADWFYSSQGIEHPDESQQIIHEVEQALMMSGERYPTIKDAGETMLGDTRSASEQFEEWFNDVSAISGQQFMDRYGII